MLLIVSLLAGCQQEVSATPERAEHTEYKGIELYSWQDETGEWKYSVAPGTNRNKTIDEVKSNPMSLDEVKAAIARMAVNERILWLTTIYDNNGQVIELPYPPIEVIEKLREYASLYQVKLYTP